MSCVPSLCCDCFIFFTSLRFVTGAGICHIFVSYGWAQRMGNIYYILILSLGFVIFLGFVTGVCQNLEFVNKFFQLWGLSNLLWDLSHMGGKRGYAMYITTYSLLCFVLSLGFDWFCHQVCHFFIFCHGLGSVTYEWVVLRVLS